jgi:hypothetical protein
MNQDYFEKISNLFKHAQEPLQAIAELNVKTLQSYTYLKPEDFSKLSKPDELLEKQLELAIANGHKGLDYLQKSFEIIEKSLLSFTQETQLKTSTKK